MGEPRSSARFRSAALAVLAVSITVGPAILLAGGGIGSSYTDAVGGIGRVPGEVERSARPRLELLGASGVLPSLEALSPELMASLAAPAAPTAQPPPPVTIPAVVAGAYRRSEQVLAQRDPECGLQWPLLAGLGRVISDHARSGDLDARGRTLGPILGPRLDGSPGLAEIPDSDEGRLDGDNRWDRASGPMQIIPAVWQRVGADSDGDALADPHSVYDAALAAGRFLCESGFDLRRADDQVRAVFRYQRSRPFVRATMLWTWAYGARTLPETAEPAPDMVLPPAESVTLSADVPPPPTQLPAGPTRPPASAPAGPRPAGDGTVPPRSAPPPSAPPRQGPPPTPAPPPEPDPPAPEPDPPAPEPDPPAPEPDPPAPEPDPQAPDRGPPPRDRDPPSPEPNPGAEPEPTSPQPTTGAPESTGAATHS